MDVKRCEFFTQRCEIDYAHLDHALYLWSYFQFQLGVHGQHESQTAHHSPLLFERILIIFHVNESIEMVSNVHDEQDEPPVYLPEGIVEILREVKFDVGLKLDLEVLLSFGLVHEGHISGQKLVEKAQQV